jgi:hypothetical protein
VDLDLGELSRALGREVSTYTVEPIDPGLRLHSVTGGVYRVRVEDVSLIIKVVRHGEDADPGGLWVAGAEPTHRNYWKREWLAFAGGLLDALPGELRAPRTLLTTERPATDDVPDEAWIWMEDVEGNPGVTWPVEDYDSVAFDLGTTQAAFASGRAPLPSEPWLSRQWLRGWVEALARDIPWLDDPEVWQHEALAPMTGLRERVAALWAEREQLLGIVEAAPQTVVHLDFWPANLIAADDGTTVAIDWSQVGIGAVGQDLDQLVLDPVWMRVLPDADPAELEKHVLRSYQSGLRSSGFEVSAEDLERWYRAAAGIHYAPMLGMAARTASDPDAVRAIESRWGVSFAELIAGRARVIDYALDCSDAVLA